MIDGRAIDGPSRFVFGAAGWGIRRKPGAIDRIGCRGSSERDAAPSRSPLSDATARRDDKLSPGLVIHPTTQDDRAPPAPRVLERQIDYRRRRR
ncbi:hypothetical protein [Methylobacterium sp. CM6246]